MIQDADLCSVRKKLGLSQEKLAEKLGVTRNTVSRWERGEVSPSADNLIALSHLLAQMEDPAAPKVEPAPPPVVPPPPPPPVVPAPVKGKRWPLVLACVGVICALLIGIATLVGTYSVMRQLEPDNVVPAEEIEKKEVDRSLNVESGTLQSLQP